MQRKVPAIASIVFFLAGCTAYQMPALTADHPASAEAISSPRAQRSQTLVYTRDDVPSRTPASEPGVAQNEGNSRSRWEGGAEKTVTGEGKVIATVPDSGQLVVEHGEIKGFMGAMTMGYPVEHPAELETLKPGDQVRFTIDVPKKAIVKIEKLQ